MDGTERQALIRVAIVDDDVWAKDRLSEALERFEDMAVVAAVLSVDELLAGPGASADLVLLDVQLRFDPVVAENVSRISRRGPRVLLISGYFGEESVRGALMAGAVGFQPKLEQFDDLVTAIRDAIAGRFVISQQAMMAVLTDRRETAPNLSRREVAVLALYATGMPLKTVAKRLNISEETAKEYVKRIREKYRDVGRQVETRVDLHTAALDDGILTDNGKHGPI